MRNVTCLRRAGWISAITIASFAGQPLLSGDDGAAGEQGATAQEAAPAKGPTPPKPAVKPKDPKRAENVAKPQGRVLTPKYRLGAALAPVPAALNDRMNLKGEGLLIQRVAPGGPAEKAGIQRDDVLLAIGDKPIKKYGDLVEASNASPGKMSVKLLRGNETLTVTVTLEKHRKGDEKMLIPRD